ncbi:hypothetical protein EXT48_12585 [Pseudoalteromonas sp. CO348]|uniref:hypothetical protein n=1 Tax=Pseudoalteromonas TaxID=53246 RepID=UPI001022EACB|nr:MULTISPECIES: hypothetical protein [Pseudoalteromonas]MCG9769171.1 hypothetical protein [Pseudoalteromonas piscicida]QZO13774.1 hypothetical protein K5642_04470 [Pseudoalteromonas piscicida]RZG04397.1 hypothetical protein EXT48_12585 [Pseudoalteromonas sp. CO348]
MKLVLTKKKFKNLSHSKQQLAKALTPNIAGGNNACSPASKRCQNDQQPSGEVTSGGVPVTF